MSSRHASVRSVIVFGSGAVSTHLVEELVQKYHVVVVTRDVQKAQQSKLGELAHVRYNWILDCIGDSVVPL
jgi:hypothetical protein